MYCKRPAKSVLVIGCSYHQDFLAMLCSLMQQPNQSSKGGFPLTGSVLAVSTVLYIRQRNSHFLHIINISTVHTYVCTVIFLIVMYVTQLSVVP